MHYALRCIIRHLSKAEPSADLREALVNTRYISVLIKLEASNDADQVADLLGDFLVFLKSSVSYTLSLFHQSYPIHCFQKFTDTEDLYLHHRNIYDRIMRKRIADFSVDFGSIVGLALAGLHLNISALFDLNKPFTDYFPAVEGGLLRIYQTLYFRHLPTHIRGSRFKPLGGIPDSCYLVLLTEFLTDPGRAGEHVLDGPKCALVAKFLLDCFVPPCSERNFLW